MSRASGGRSPGHRKGLSASLRSGIENLSGFDVSDVRVHRNSNEPRKIGALAYTDGTDIHLGPGQDAHLPHEAWHVVQQRQDRVAARFQTKGVSVNDDAELEREADIMGARALRQGLDQQGTTGTSVADGYGQRSPSGPVVVQGFWPFTGHGYIWNKAPVTPRMTDPVPDQASTGGSVVVDPVIVPSVAPVEVADELGDQYDAEYYEELRVRYANVVHVRESVRRELIDARTLSRKIDAMRPRLIEVCALSSKQFKQLFPEKTKEYRMAARSAAAAVDHLEAFEGRLDDALEFRLPTPAAGEGAAQWYLEHTPEIERRLEDADQQIGLLYREDITTELGGLREGFVAMLATAKSHVSDSGIGVEEEVVVDDEEESESEGVAWEVTNDDPRLLFVHSGAIDSAREIIRRVKGGASMKDAAKGVISSAPTRYGETVGFMFEFRLTKGNNQLRLLAYVDGLKVDFRSIMSFHAGGKDQGALSDFT